METIDLEELRREQESLLAVIESISGEPDLRPLLTQIVRSACELIGAERGTICLLDPERRVVQVEAAHGMPPAEVGREFAPGLGLVGQVLRRGQPVVLDRYGDLERPTLPALAEDAVLGLPILWRGRLIGVFGVGAGPPRRFSERDVDRLTLFARHAAIAIENTRLLHAGQRRAARIFTINQIGRLVAGNLGLDQLLTTATEAIYEHFRYARVQLFLVDPDDPAALALRAWRDIDGHAIPSDYRQRIGDGIVGEAAQARRTILVEDVAADPRYIPIPGSDRTQAELAVPIVADNTLLGVLNIESERPINDEDIEGMAIVADQLGGAIQNAHLFARVKAALAEMQMLYETSSRIATAADVDEVIGAYLAQVAAQGRYACSVALYDMDESGDWSTVVVRGQWTPHGGLRLPLRERFPRARDGLDAALDVGQTVTIADVRTDARVSDLLREIQARDGRPALAMIPLMARGQRIGLVILSSPQPREWRDTELWPYQATAAQLAAVIDSRLQQQTLFAHRQQLAVLRERQWLAHELHDSVTQLIFSLTLIAQSIGPAWQRDPAEGERRVARVVALGRAAQAEMRALLVDLRPDESRQAGTATPPPSIAAVRRDGLAGALRRLTAGLAEQGLRVDLDAERYRPQAVPREEALYRIAQEALNNVVKHAGARRVRVRLAARRGATLLIIADDGVGIGQGRRGLAGTRPPARGSGCGRCGSAPPSAAARRGSYPGPAGARPWPCGSRTGRAPPRGRRSEHAGAADTRADRRRPRDRP